MKRPAIVREFMQHDVFLVDENNKSQRITHVLAYVQQYTYYFGTNIYSYPTEIWANKFEPYSNFSYMPVGRIQQKCVAVKATLKGNNQREKINVIIPLPSATRLQNIFLVLDLEEFDIHYGYLKHHCTIFLS